MSSAHRVPKPLEPNTDRLLSTFDKSVRVHQQQTTGRQFEVRVLPPRNPHRP